MLLIARKKGESIHIGDEVVVTVLEIRNGQIRLGFEAPRWVRIRRAECAEREANCSESRELVLAEECQ